MLAALVPGTPCELCQRPMYPERPLDVDHVIPRAEGGAHGPVRLVHRGCNARRGQALGVQRRRAGVGMRPDTPKTLRWCEAHEAYCSTSHSRAW
ncbi:HNH endonuclease [Actinocatenispora comari]